MDHSKPVAFVKKEESILARLDCTKLITHGPFSHHQYLYHPLDVAVAVAGQSPQIVVPSLPPPPPPPGPTWVQEFVSVTVTVVVVVGPPLVIVLVNVNVEVTVPPPGRLIVRVWVWVVA